MKEVELYAPMVRGAAGVGIKMFHPQEGAAKAPCDLVGVAPLHALADDDYTVDYILWHPPAHRNDVGVAIAIEVKQIDRHPGRPGEVLPWGLFASHQKTWLREFAEAGAISLAVIWYAPARELIAYILKPGAGFAEGTFCAEIPHTTLQKLTTPDRFVGWNTVISLWANNR